MKKHVRWQFDACVENSMVITEHTRGAMNIISPRRWGCEIGTNKKKKGEIAICPSKWNQSETFKVTVFAKSKS